MHRTIEKDLFRALRAESGDRWKRMECCESGEWRLEEREVFGKKKKRKTARERTQEPFKKTARIGILAPRKETQGPMKETAMERTPPAPLKAKATRRRGGEFRKNGRK